MTLPPSTSTYTPASVFALRTRRSFCCLRSAEYTNRLDYPDEIGDAFDPCMAPYGAFCVSHKTCSTSLERHPALADRHIHFASRNRCIPPQRGTAAARSVSVRSAKPGRRTLMSLATALTPGTRCAASWAASFSETNDPAVQRDDPILDHNPDFVGSDVCIPINSSRTSVCFSSVRMLMSILPISFPCFRSCEVCSRRLGQPGTPVRWCQTCYGDPLPADCPL